MNEQFNSNNLHGKYVKIDITILYAVPLFTLSFKLLPSWFDMIYLLTAIGLSPGGRSTVHIYTQTIYRTIQNKQYIEQHNNLGECGLCPFLASFTLAFALQPRKKHGKPSVRVDRSNNVRLAAQIVSLSSMQVPSSSFYSLRLRVKHSHKKFLRWLQSVLCLSVRQQICQSRWPFCLMHRSAVAYSVGLRVRIPLRAWMSVYCECCVLSGRFFIGLITRPEDYYQVWCVGVCVYVCVCVSLLSG
jgi:hypothetical protein